MSGYTVYPPTLQMEFMTPVYLPYEIPFTGDDKYMGCITHIARYLLSIRSTFSYTKYVAIIFDVGSFFETCEEEYLFIERYQLTRLNTRIDGWGDTDYFAQNIAYIYWYHGELPDPVEVSLMLGNFLRLPRGMFQYQYDSPIGFVDPFPLPYAAAKTA